MKVEGMTERAEVIHIILGTELLHNRVDLLIKKGDQESIMKNIKKKGKSFQKIFKKRKTR
jgi:hypothetical protein